MNTCTPLNYFGDNSTFLQFEVIVIGTFCVYVCVCVRSIGLYQQCLVG